jgi:protein translocase SecG subunit
MLTLIQIVLAVLLIITILLQQRGSGLSGTFGGESNVYATRRGIEKTILYSSIVIAVLFFTVSLLRIVL